MNREELKKHIHGWCQTLEFGECRPSIATDNIMSAIDSHLSSQWVSVEEKLPEENGYGMILEFSGLDEGTYRYIMEMAKSIKNLKSISPLPSPPKTKKDE